MDADPGDQSRVSQLSQAIDLAKLELGAQVHIELDPLRAYSRNAGGQPYAERSVTLGLLRHEGEWGLLWYSKPVLCEDSPTRLLAHREIDSEFPHTSTVDQFFDVSTFEAYRDLGRHNARLIKDGRQALARALDRSQGDQKPVSVPDGPGDWAVREFLSLANEFDWPDVLEGARNALGLTATESPE